MVCMITFSYENDFCGSYPRNAHGYTCASIDEMYCKGERTMDFLSPAGWLCPSWY